MRTISNRLNQVAVLVGPALGPAGSGGFAGLGVLQDDPQLRSVELPEIEEVASRHAPTLSDSPLALAWAAFVRYSAWSARYFSIASG